MDSVVKYSQKITKIAHILVCDIQTIDFVELNFNLKFWSGILSGIGGQILKFAAHFSEFTRQFF